METQKTIIIFKSSSRNIETDIEVPLDISANDLVIGLNQAFSLNIDTTDIKKCYLKAENPICLLKGKMTLKEFGIRSGTIIFTDK